MFQRAAKEYQISIFEEAKEIFPKYTAEHVKVWADSGINCIQSVNVTPLLIACSHRNTRCLEQRK